MAQHNAHNYTFSKSSWIGIYVDFLKILRLAILKIRSMLCSVLTVCPYTSFGESLLFNTLSKTMIKDDGRWRRRTLWLDELRWQLAFLKNATS